MSAQGKTDPLSPEYRTKEARIKTFEGVSFIAQTHKDLSDAGLFYIKAPDTVQCFQCGKKLSHWIEDDSPLFEHFRLSPMCSYVLEQLDETSIKTLGCIFRKADKLEEKRTFYERSAFRMLADFKLSAVFQEVAISCHNEEQISNIEKAFIYKLAGSYITPSIVDIKKIMIDLEDIKENEIKQSVIAVYQQYQENIDKTKKMAQEYKKSYALELENIRAEIGETFLSLQQRMEKKEGQHHMEEKEDQHHMEEKEDQQHHEKKDAEFEHIPQGLAMGETNTFPQYYSGDEEMARQLQDEENHRNNECRKKVYPKKKKKFAISEIIATQMENLVLKDAEKCILCHNNPRAIIFIPCGHFRVCETCAEQLEECSSCKRPIKNKFKPASFPTPNTLL